jgi:sugar O-acyltransferase (sialic acid O-acetyltransferase NeuD family)
MKLYGIYGASGFGREVMPVARAMLAATAEPHQLLFIDDDSTPRHVNGHRVLTYADFLAMPAAERYVTVTIADSRIRERIVETCRADGVRFLTVRAANAVSLDEVTLGEGSVVQPFVTFTSNVVIGRHFHANIYSYVAHDCVIGDYVTFAPGVKCNGNIHVHDHAYIGTGAVIRQGHPGAPIVIGRGAVVGMGAVVTKSVPEGITVVGNPARPMASS